MITGAIRNKVDKIWLDIFAGGITNPLAVIEQLTYPDLSRCLGIRKQIHTDGARLLLEMCVHRL